MGAATLAASLRCGATLLAFYAASSRLTSYREQAKAVDDDFKPGGQRDWVQVTGLIMVKLGQQLHQQVQSAADEVFTVLWQALGQPARAAVCHAEHAESWPGLPLSNYRATHLSSGDAWCPYCLSGATPEGHVSELHQLPAGLLQCRRAGGADRCSCGVHGGEGCAHWVGWAACCGPPRQAEPPFLAPRIVVVGFGRIRNIRPVGNL